MIKFAISNAIFASIELFLFITIKEFNLRMSFDNVNLFSNITKKQFDNIKTVQHC